MKINALLLLSLVLLSCCTSKIDSKTYSSLVHTGNEVTTKAQAVLLSNVGRSIQKGGAEYAVEFCNIHASKIIDSLNHVNNCNILRVSKKNRNPDAGLSSKQENELWELFSTGGLKDTVVSGNGRLTYYKAIKIAMPACLNCHGSKENNINKETQQILSKLYPEDLATDYKLNDFRGLWKVEFEE